MSLRIVNAVNNSTVTPGAIPCGGLETAQAYPQSGVRQNETLQIRFNGVPPFNLTPSICDNNRSYSYCYCGTQVTQLESNVFNWTVGSFTFNWTDMKNQTLTVFTPEDRHSVIWTAIELNRTAIEKTPYYSSPNFTISTTSYDNPRSEAFTQAIKLGKMGLVSWSLLTLVLLGLMTEM